MKTNPTTRYQRRSNPPAMRFQERDREIIQAIQKYDGILTRRQIKDMFWSQRNFYQHIIRGHPIELRKVAPYLHFLFSLKYFSLTRNDC